MHGDWCPKDRKAEDGIIPLKYKLKETKEKEYSFRTRMNVIDSDGTLIFFSKKISGGTLLTQKIVREHKKPLFFASPGTNSSQVIEWLISNNIKTLNVAGPRQSEWNNAYTATFLFISNLIKQIRKRELQIPSHPFNIKK